MPTQSNLTVDSDKGGTFRRNIALLLDSAPRTWTSQEEIHYRLCRALREHGIRPVLVYAAKLPPEIEQRLLEGGAVIETISYASGPLHYYKQLGRVINQYSITMVHVCFFDYFSLIPWLARLRGMRAIIFEELNSGMMQATSWKAKLIRLRTYLTALPMMRVIAISHFVKEDLVKRGMREDRVIVRHLGVDQERFRPDPSARERWAAAYPLEPDELLLSTVTVLRPFKNPETILRACALLLQRGIRFRLFVAGDGSMLSELRDLSEQLGIAGQIHWLGYCSDPTSLLQASDIFLLASVGEAFGLVLAEAMACGVPVVGSRSGAIPEIVQDGQTGLLATPRDERSFADAIEKLFRDDRLRRQMGVNSLARVSEKFNVDLDVENTIRIYDSFFSYVP